MVLDEVFIRTGKYTSFSLGWATISNKETIEMKYKGRKPLKLFTMFLIDKCIVWTIFCFIDLIKQRCLRVKF